VKKFKNIAIIGCTGKTLPIRVVADKNVNEENSEMLLEHVLRIIFQNVQPSDQNDTTFGKSLLIALDTYKGKDIIEIEDTVWEWLVRQSEKIVYRLPIPIYPNGEIVMDIIKNGFLKEEKPKGG
jgi:hypothetical protein